MEEVSSKKRGRDDSDELVIDSAAEVKRLREDLLDDLDELEICTAETDLDSFMKSFESEIAASPSGAAATAAVVDLTSESGESQPDLGYLLGASDDELGLPPATASPVVTENADLIRVSSDSSELSGDLWGLAEQMPSYDSFEFGTFDSGNFTIAGGEYEALDGLFDHSDLNFGSGDYLWRPETLPAN